MEIRASYVVVGAVVLALLAGLAAFSLWLVEAGVDRNLARYEIAFAGSVSGLPEGGQVLYRGIPVGRVADIRIDPDQRRERAGGGGDRPRDADQGRIRWPRWSSRV